MDWHAFFEPEETVGRLWNRLVGEKATLPRHGEAAVPFSAVSRSIGIVFRGLGGLASVEIKPAEDAVSTHRLSWRQRLGRDDERIAAARFTGEALFLPADIALFPEADLNRALYFWLAGWAVAAADVPLEKPWDPLARDVARLRHAHRASEIAKARFPGLARSWTSLAAATLAARPERRLPPAETAVEALVGHLLGCPAPIGDALRLTELIADPSLPLDRLVAPPNYKPYLPVALWGDFDPTRTAPSGSRSEADVEPGSGKSDSGERKSRRAKRRKSDQVDRPDAFFMHRFDKILSWAEFLNLHRDVEDDD